METRRRSARLQVQSQSAQNVEAAAENTKKTTARGKKNETAPMKAKAAPKPKAAPKRVTARSNPPEDLDDVDLEPPAPAPKSKAAPKKGRKAPIPASEDPEIDIDEPVAPKVKFAPKGRSAPQKAATPASENPEMEIGDVEEPAAPEVKSAPEDPESDDEMDTTEPSPVKPRTSRPRRSVVSTKRVSYVAKDDLDGIMELSSSSSDASDSEDQMELTFETAKAAPTASAKKRVGKNVEVVPKKRSKAYRISSESSSSDSYESDSEASNSEDSEAPGPSQKPSTSRGGWKSSGKSSGKSKASGGGEKDMHWPKCSKASIARKTGNPKNSKTVKSSLRMATKPKPPQPWKKNLQNYEADRKMAKGERRMLEYRVVAHAYARGKIEEVSYDECFKIHENMKKAYFEGRKIIEALDGPDAKNGGDGEEDGKKKKKMREKAPKEDSDSNGDSSEDEWEEMEHFQPVLDDNIKVSIDHEENDDDGVEKDWWVIYLRQEVNKKIRESWENTHKVHLLCYMAHLKLAVKTALDESLVPSLIMSQLPNGYLRYVGEAIPIDVMKNMVKWFCDAFRPLNGVVSVAAIEQDLLEGHEARYPATSRLTALVDGKCYETDLDRATLLFCLLRGMEIIARIVVNARTIPRRWDKNQQKRLQQEMDKFRELSRSRSITPKDEKEEEATSSTAEEKKEKERRERNQRRPREKRWICIDPLHKTVDEPLTIHENAAHPISYVFAIDNRQGICEVSQRYAMDCVKQEFRRRRTDPKWIAYTLSLYPFAANLERKKWEAMQMREDLVKRPLPTVMSEYKNHPLYVLEKDLLKFEAIYPPPETQKPLGQIRGHNVYPRSCVFTLQGENNWLKLARSVKVGEEPYKVVKARPDPRVPVEDRVDQFLNVYGYWQTEQYRRPPLKKGKIPHNDYGNVYMFNECMCPLECVHLKLPGLVAISRKLDKQCVPAVVGWAFDGGWTHPVMDGAIVLEKDAPAFIKEWERLEAGRAAKEEKARVDRIHENWRKLIKGMLRLAYVRKQFGATAQLKKAQKKKKKVPEEKEEEMEEAGPSEPTDHIIDNSAKVGPLEGFSLDDFINKKK
uniref:Rad4 domain-containing protein n=1 Tax=Caenorhabditis tropicalis TaxID=1561998 RepID=A0A1I7TQF6_9PELO